MHSTSPSLPPPSSLLLRPYHHTGSRRGKRWSTPSPGRHVLNMALSATVLSALFTGAPPNMDLVSSAPATPALSVQRGGGSWTLSSTFVSSVPWFSSLSFSASAAPAIPIPPPAGRGPRLGRKVTKRQDSDPTEDNKDPCFILGQAQEPEITFDQVKDCYDSVPFNGTESRIVLNTLYKFFRDYYVFLDYAMLEGQARPYTNPPVDILGGLEQIGEKVEAGVYERMERGGDMTFHRDMDLLVQKLNDAHANYMIECYRHYLFVQPFELYAPVVEGVQSIRILQDRSVFRLDDCEVLTIDDTPAIDAIQTWADTHFAISKDRGVRFNKALAAMAYDPETQSWGLTQGQFTTRATLPDKGTMTYQLKCPPSERSPQGREQRVEAPWQAYRLVSWNEFNSTGSFLEQNCFRDTDPNQGKKKEEEGKDDEQKEEEDENEGGGEEDGNEDGGEEGGKEENDKEDKHKDKDGKKKNHKNKNHNKKNHKNKNENEGEKEDKAVAPKACIACESRHRRRGLSNRKRNAAGFRPQDIQAAVTMTPHRTIRPLEPPSLPPATLFSPHSILEPRQNPEPAAATEDPNEPQPDYTNIAKLIHHGETTAFYQLVRRPTIGIVVIPTHSVNLETESQILIDGFHQLYAAGVENIIMDMTGNGGGYVNFAYDLVDWMFPQPAVQPGLAGQEETTKPPLSVLYGSDLRASMSVRALASRDLEEDEYNSYFNPGTFSPTAIKALENHDEDEEEQDEEDKELGKEAGQKTVSGKFTTNFYLNNTLQQRLPRHPLLSGNRQNPLPPALDYTPLVYMNHKLGQFEMGMPWQHSSSRIVLMTDGACGSACGMSLNRLKNRHKVKSYAVGGRIHEPLSLFSFPGASVYALDSLLDDFEALEVDSPMSRLRYRGIYRVPVMEFFWEKEEDEEQGGGEGRHKVPIEYRPELFAADFQVDHTPLTARYHEILWEMIADQHWGGEVRVHP